MVTHAFNSSTQRHRQADLWEFKATLVYRVSSRTARATQKISVLREKWGEGAEQQRRSEKCPRRKAKELGRG